MATLFTNVLVIGLEEVSGILLKKNIKKFMYFVWFCFVLCFVVNW